MHEGPLVVVSGGGTGGHLYPALAIADALRELRPDVRVLFVGARGGLEARVLPERGEEHVLVPVQGLDRSRPLRSWTTLAALARSLVRVARLFSEARPEAVVVTGGYAGAPAGILAGLTGIPLVLQEQNSVPGAVTKLLSRWASRIHVAFPDAADSLASTGATVRLSGNPVRPASTASREAVRAGFGIPADARLVLVSGGSQGSLALNRVIGEVVRGVSEGTLDRPECLHVLWSTGPKHLQAVTELVRACLSPHWVHAVPYIDDLPTAQASADLAVSRAGAMSTAELLNQGLPAILVPFPYAAADHQMYNAQSLERAGVALVAPESELTGAKLWAEVESLLAEPRRLGEMRSNATLLAKPHAARDIGADIASFLTPPAVPA